MDVAQCWLTVIQIVDKREITMFLHKPIHLLTIFFTGFLIIGVVYLCDICFLFPYLFKQHCYFFFMITYQYHLYNSFVCHNAADLYVILQPSLHLLISSFVNQLFFLCILGISTSDWHCFLQAVLDASYIHFVPSFYSS